MPDETSTNVFGAAHLIDGSYTDAQSFPLPSMHKQTLAVSKENLIFLEREKGELR